MKLCWLIPDDRGGGIVSVALSCCQQAQKAGHETTLLLVLSPTGWIGTNYDVQIKTLGLTEPALETPISLLEWLAENPQDVLILNACGQADAVIPYLPANLKCVYVVHDTAPRYWQTALKEEANLEAVVAVSQTVSTKFKHLMQQPEKLAVILNGSVFPEPPTPSNPRYDDLIFLGGDKPIKGSSDVLELWQHLIKLEFSGKLHWFGEINPKFHSKIIQLPKSNQIYLHGRVTRDQIFSTAACAKVLLMLSRVEPFGMATIEAMSMGCVPVAWDIDTGTKEIVCANETGLFAPLSDVKTLAHQVMQACDRYSNFQGAVIEQARSKFNQTVMWQGYESLIDQVCKFEPIKRSKNGLQPEEYKPPLRRFQLLPPSIRSSVREFVGHSPRLGYWLRDLRGL